MATQWLVNAAFTAASSQTADSSTSSKVIPWSPSEGPSGDHAQGHQALRTFVDVDTSGGTATLEFVITENVNGTERVVLREVGTVTVTARRSATAGNAGAYLCDVSWASTGRDTIDGFGVYPECKAYINLTAIGGSAATVNVRIAATRNAG